MESFAFAPLILAIAIHASAVTPPPPLTTISGSLVQSLDGEWQSAQDPQDTGLSAKWYETATFPTGAAKPAQVPGSVTETWPVPALWTGPATHIYWYQKAFTLSTVPPPHTRYYLRFGAVKETSDIWLNGALLGHHEGDEIPFEFDVSSLVKAGEPNTVTVRLATAQQGGIYQHVTLVAQPEVRIVDAFARPDAKSAQIHLEITLENKTNAPVQVDLVAALGQFRPALFLDQKALEITAKPGESVAKVDLPVKQPHLWDLDDPFLYTIKVQSRTALGGDVYSFRTGFRDFRVINGYFTLNGKRLLIKSLHGNYYDPVSLQGNSRDWTWLGLDFPRLKNAGFNMMRMIKSAALPEQLEQADEMGFLIFAEHQTSWMLQDPAKFGFTLKAVARRDRNHPSLVLWGLLNENGNQDIYHRAKDFLPALRSVDDTRAVLLSSGRWDNDFKTGTLSNPGSSTWDTYMGGEDSVSPKPTGPLPELGAYHDGTGDAHIYPLYPLSWDVITDYAKIDADNPNPIFISESGIGSSFDPFDEEAHLAAARAAPTCPSWSWASEGVNGFNKAWTDFGLTGTYATPSDMLKDSALEAAQQRALIFSIVRGNPKVNGYSLTSLEDFFGAGEGVLTNFRDYKPGHLPVLRQGWARLRWCILLSSTNVYAGDLIHLKVALANEDELPAGNYPATISISSQGGTASPIFQRQVAIAVQDRGPLAYPVLDEDIKLPAGLDPGTYMVQASLAGKRNAAAPQQAFSVASRAALPRLSGAISALGLPDNIRDLLTGQGAQMHDYAPAQPIDRETIVIGPDFHGTTTDWRALYTKAARGAHLIFLAAHTFNGDRGANQWLAVPNKGSQNTAPDWLYHKDVVAKAVHPLFAGLPTRLMIPEYYGGLLGHTSFFQDTTLPPDVAAVALYSSLTDQYHFIDGLMLGTYPFHAGHFTISSFNIAGTIGLPATDRLLLNIVAAGQKDAAPVANVPPGLEGELDQLGFIQTAPPKPGG